MAVFQYERSGTIFFGVRFHKRSAINPRIDVQKQKTGFTTERDAERALKKLRDEVINEVSRREHAGSSFGELMEKWELALIKGVAAERALQRTTIEDNVRILQIYCESWMNKPAGGINILDVRDVLHKMAQEGKSNSRRRSLLGAINGVFNWGIEARLLSGVIASPAKGIKVSRKEERKQPILKISEICRLVETARLYQHPWYPIWAAALLTGMRSGELFALEWRHVDLDSPNPVIRVEASYNGRAKEFKATKAGYWREVPINDDLRSILQKLRMSQENGPYVFPRIVDWQRGEQARILRAFCVGIGITPVPFHALRACFATQMLQQNIPPVVVRKICGWKELKTMEVYVRRAGIEIAGATDKLRFISPHEALSNVLKGPFGQPDSQPNLS